ncbi:MAG: Tab2/Atab2 family RNA-binding protein, partial [Coleofasciculus sp. C2-GNP5-27]
MNVWQADFYRRPLRDETGQVLWELLICDPTGNVIYESFCPQPEVTRDWLVSQVQVAAANTGLPDAIQVFRPQSLNLFQ